MSIDLHINEFERNLIGNNLFEEKKKKKKMRNKYKYNPSLIQSAALTKGETNYYIDKMRRIERKKYSTNNLL